MGERRVKLIDVARRAGVSVGTASRALGDGKGCAGPTRERVLRAAAELHFTPNGLIRALQRGKSNTIGVTFWNLAKANPRGIILPMLQGILMGIAATQMDAMIYSEVPGRTGQGLVNTFLDKRIDGLICFPDTLKSDALETLAASGLPTVVLYARQVPDGLGTVDVDNEGGAKTAVSHLLDLGHRRIVFDGWMQSPNLAGRAAGYRAALAERGVACDPALFLAPDAGWTDINQAADRLLSLADPPTAIFAATDSRAFDWLEILHKRGVRVPEDISLVGFDDVPSATLPPGLSTVRQPCGRLGRAAAQLVQSIIQGDLPPQERHVVLPVEFIARGTTGPASRSTRRVA